MYCKEAHKQNRRLVTGDSHYVRFIRLIFVMHALRSQLSLYAILEEVAF